MPKTLFTLLATLLISLFSFGCSEDTPEPAPEICNTGLFVFENKSDKSYEVFLNDKSFVVVPAGNTYRNEKAPIGVYSFTLTSGSKVSEKLECKGIFQPTVFE